MKKNLYYEAVFKRNNVIKVAILSFFLTIASWPRLLLEVFIRKNFGERYFSMSTAIILSFILCILPVSFYTKEHYRVPSLWEAIGENIAWYLYVAAFLAASILRQKEVMRLPSVFDFARFSLSTGKINPNFFKIKIGGKTPGIRTISIILEPLFFFVVGLLLLPIHLGLGRLILGCSLCYSFSYWGAFYQGDNFIMDKIDEIICGEELVDSFVQDNEPGETRGFYAYGKRPVNPDFRRKVVESFFEDEETVDAE